MITARNVMLSLPLSARTATADLKTGMVVKFVQSAASGDQPLVAKATAADLVDPTVLKGVVDFIQPDSQYVEFSLDTTTLTITPLAESIPQGAQVNVWTVKPVIAYHASKLDASLSPATIREGAVVAIDGDTSLPALYSAGATDGRQKAVGTVYRVDGPEVTIFFHSL